jgi:hypothetical protein
MIPTTPRERNKSRFCERNIIGKEEQKSRKGDTIKHILSSLKLIFESQGSGDRSVVMPQLRM